MTLGRRTIQSDANALQPYLNKSTVGRAYNMFLALPQLRGFWPMSSIDDAFAAYDLSKQGRTLTATSLTAASFGVKNIMPYTTYDGSADYHSRADEAGMDIASSMTMGCWFSPTTTPTGTSEVIMGKDGTGGGNDEAYSIWRQATSGQIRAHMSDDGATTYQVNNTTTVPVAGSWYFLVLRFVPSTSVDSYVNNEKKSNTSSIPATIYNTSEGFAIGARHPSSAQRFMNGDISLAFICAASLTDSHIAALYNATKGLFK